MSKKYNDLFKIVSFRSPEDQLTINIDKPPFKKNTLLKNLQNSHKSKRLEIESILDRAFNSIITLEHLQTLSIYTEANRFKTE